MGRRKGRAIDLLQDEEEFRHWFLPKGAVCPECGQAVGEGRSYQWIVDEYARKYRDPMDSTKPLVISRSTVGTYRTRLGLQRRNVSDVELIPWKVKEEHLGHRLVKGLRNVAMVRAWRNGERARPSDKAIREAASFEADLKEAGLVVRYEPDTEEGFYPFPARPGIDNDLIYEPGHTARLRGVRD